LRIKELKSEDAGMYICKVINGFGTAEVGVTLLVLGELFHSKFIAITTKNVHTT
jgi:hypothetical protein